MSVYVLMNWGAWALSAILFGFVIVDFMKTNKTYDESFILGTFDQDDPGMQKHFKKEMTL